MSLERRVINLVSLFFLLSSTSKSLLIKITIIIIIIIISASRPDLVIINKQERPNKLKVMGRKLLDWLKKEFFLHLI